MSYSGNLISDSDVSNWLVGTTDAEKQAVIDRVEDIIEKVCQDAFYQQSFDIFCDGNGKNRLFMPFLPDLLSISSVKISGITLSSDYYTFDTHSIYLSELATSTYELNYLLSYVNDRCIFPRGIGNIAIVGVRGIAVVPPAIKYAAIMMAQDANDDSLYTRYFSGSEGIGSYSSSYRREVYTGILEVDQILDHYIKRRAILFA